MSQALVVAKPAAVPAQLPVRASGYGQLLINYIKDLQKGGLFDEPVQEHIEDGHILVDYVPVRQNNVNVGHAFQLDIHNDKVTLHHRDLNMDANGDLPVIHSTEFRPRDYAGMALMIAGYAKEHLSFTDFNPQRESRIAEAITRFVHSAGQLSEQSLQAVTAIDQFRQIVATGVKQKEQLDEFNASYAGALAPYRDLLSFLVHDRIDNRFNDRDGISYIDHPASGKPVHNNGRILAMGAVPVYDYGVLSGYEVTGETKGFGGHEVIPIQRVAAHHVHFIGEYVAALPGSKIARHCTRAPVEFQSSHFEIGKGFRKPDLYLLDEDSCQRLLVQRLDELSHTKTPEEMAAYEQTANDIMTSIQQNPLPEIIRGQSWGTTIKHALRTMLPFNHLLLNYKGA